MQNTERNDIFLKTLAAILIRSFLIGLAFLLLWFVLYLIVPEWMFEMNAKWFNIGKRDFDLINYFGMGFVKISILLFFFFPYLAIRSMLRKKERKSSSQS
jgi:nitrate reductase gamma subunit